jgi:hypothetical protein
MAKAEKPSAKPKSKPDKEQAERFKETARQLGIHDTESGERFEQSFTKIVPPKRKFP